MISFSPRKSAQKKAVNISIYGLQEALGFI